MRVGGCCYGRQSVVNASSCVKLFHHYLKRIVFIVPLIVSCPPVGDVPTAPVVSGSVPLLYEGDELEQRCGTQRKSLSYAYYAHAYANKIRFPLCAFL